MASSIGAILIALGLIPFFATMFVLNDFSLIMGDTLWIALGVAIALGLLAAITAIGSGLNTTGTFITFVLSFGTAIYVSLVILTIPIFGEIPYNWGYVLQAFCTCCYVFGLFFLIAKE